MSTSLLQEVDTAYEESIYWLTQQQAKARGAGNWPFLPTGRTAKTSIPKKQRKEKMKESATKESDKAGKLSISIPETSEDFSIELFSNSSREVYMNEESLCRCDGFPLDSCCCTHVGEGKAMGCEEN